MIKLVFVILLCAQAYARPNYDIDPLIVGGTPAAEGQYPFIVSLRHYSGEIFCGGALISPRHVLTAAHCVYKKSFVRIGTSSVYLDKQKLHDVLKIFVHEDYKPTDNGNDIAVLKLKTALKLDEKIQTINFPVTENMDDKNVTALGWGATTVDGFPSSELLYLNKPIMRNRECSKRLNTKIAESQICLASTEYKGMCFGDSGSPLLYKGPDGKNYIAGIVSWGVPCAQGFPDVFTRVSSFTDWIKENMR